MALSVWFWLFFALWILGGFYVYREQPSPGRWGYYGGHLILGILLFLLGLHDFGSIIK